VLLRLFMMAAALFLQASGARRRRLRCGDLSVVYYRLGPPPWSRRRRRRGQRTPAEPWLLLHGLGSVAATWGRVLHALRRECVLVVPELSALGGTRAPADALDLEQAARVAARLIEQELDGGPVTVAGLSMGAWMAMRLAQRRPELIARLVLIDAAGYRHQDWERIRRLVRVADLAGVDLLYGAMFGTPPWVMRHSRRGFLQAYTSPAVRNLLDSLTERDTYGKRDLARLAVPVALIWGERDGLFQLDCARAMAAAIPGACLYVLRGCGHAVHLECPRALASALLAVRRECPPAPPPARRGPGAVGRGEAG
jgi:pimeloyl-ACP methyl ester carboxylesterase